MKFWKYLTTGLIATAVIGYLISFFEKSEGVSFHLKISFWLLGLSLFFLILLGVFKYKKYQLVLYFSISFLLSEILLMTIYESVFNIDLINNDPTRFLWSLLIFLFYVPLYCILSFKKYGTILLILLGIIIMSFILKSFHLPGVGPLLLITFGISGLMFISQIFLSIFTIKSNRFLTTFGIICSAMLAVSYIGILSKMMHWPGNDYLYNYTVLLLFVVISVILIAAIQFTDFIKWHENHRKFLVRNILIPWFFIFIYAGFITLFPEMYKDLMGRKGAPWGMADYEIVESAR